MEVPSRTRLVWTIPLTPAFLFLLYRLCFLSDSDLRVLAWIDGDLGVVRSLARSMSVVVRADCSGPHMVWIQSIRARHLAFWQEVKPFICWLLVFHDSVTMGYRSLSHTHDSCPNTTAVECRMSGAS